MPSDSQVLPRSTRLRFDLSDVIEEVAQYLPKRELRSLALAASCCRRPAQRHMFKSFTVLLPPYPTSLPRPHNPCQLFIDNPKLCDYVHHLTFRGWSNKSRCTFTFVYNFVAIFPRLSRLTLTTLRWVTDPDVHQRLATPRPMSQISIISVRMEASSPLELLTLATRCDRVIIAGCDFSKVINYADDIQIKLQSTELTIDNKRRSDWSVIVPLPITVPIPISRISRLVALDVDSSVADALCITILDSWKDTLQMLHFRIGYVRDGKSHHITVAYY